MTIATQPANNVSNVMSRVCESVRNSKPDQIYYLDEATFNRALSVWEHTGRMAIIAVYGADSETLSLLVAYRLAGIE